MSFKGESVKVESYANALIVDSVIHRYIVMKNNGSSGGDRLHLCVKLILEVIGRNITLNKLKVVLSCLVNGIKNDFTCLSLRIVYRIELICSAVVFIRPTDKLLLKTVNDSKLRHIVKVYGNVSVSNDRFQGKSVTAKISVVIARFTACRVPLNSYSLVAELKGMDTCLAGYNVALGASPVEVIVGTGRISVSAVHVSIDRHRLVNADVSVIVSHKSKGLTLFYSRDSFICIIVANVTDLSYGV